MARVTFSGWTATWALQGFCYTEKCVIILLYCGLVLVDAKILVFFSKRMMLWGFSWWQSGGRVWSFGFEISLRIDLLWFMQMLLAKVNESRASRSQPCNSTTSSKTGKGKRFARRNAFISLFFSLLIPFTSLCSMEQLIYMRYQLNQCPYVHECSLVLASPIQRWWFMQHSPQTILYDYPWVIWLLSLREPILTEPKSICWVFLRCHWGYELLVCLPESHNSSLADRASSILSNGWVEYVCDRLTMVILSLWSR